MLTLYNESINQKVGIGMAENTMQPEEMIAAPRGNMAQTMLDGISHTLRHRGTISQRILCALMMALLSLVRLPGGGYCCQTAMFAVLLRQGFVAAPAFAGAAAGFAWGFMRGDWLCCWQTPVCTLLWLSSGLWAQRSGRMAMAGAVFAAQLTAAAVTGVYTPLALITALLTACAGAGLSVLYDGAAAVVCHRDELDGQTRPLCVTAVCASLAFALLDLPYGPVLACALAAYLTLEHAYMGGGAQALLCAGVVGGVVSLGLGSVLPCAMLLTGGFLAGEIRSGHRCVCALLMLSGMAAVCALLGGEAAMFARLVWMLPGFLPFLLLPGSMRAGITGLIEQPAHETLTQSEAIAVRCASMIHAWAGLYEDTAQMMEALCAPQEENTAAAQCVQLLRKTSAAAHQVCARTLGEIRPDDDAFRRVRCALINAGMEQVRPAYAIRVGGRREVMLLRPEQIAPASLERLVSAACGVPMRSSSMQGMPGTQAVFEQSPPLTLEIGAALRSRSGEEVAGDGYLSRSLPGGRHVLALSDGMGSGVSAMQESHAALSLTAQSLRAGYTRAQALDVVNALMLMCTGREMYATMDLCVLDLHSGETAFEKLGACPSYVVREGEVRAVGADTLPVGVLPDVESHSLRMTLRQGDVIVMLTDGLQESFPGGEEALREAIASLSWLHPQAIGEKLIERALSGGQARDDMAALCARVGRRQP